MVLSAAACLLAAQTASAQAPGWLDGPNNLESRRQNASTTVAAGQNAAAKRMEALQKEYARLTELIAKLKSQMDQAASTTIASQANLDCAKTAVAAREKSVGDAYAGLTGCTAGALSARKTALENAWGMAGNRERNAAVNKAWEDFSKTRKECQTAYKTAIKNAWDAFKTATKNCKLGNFEGIREGHDQALGN